MYSVVIELIHLDCKIEKHTEQETDRQNGKTNRKIFVAIIYSEFANPKITSTH